MTTILGLSVGDKITAPMPFTGKACYDPVEKLAPLKIHRATYYRPVPRLHRKLFNIGLSAAGAADVILTRRNRDPGHGIAYELIRAAYQNRHALRQQLPGAARYR